MSTHTTTNHEEIREWVEQHGGRPALMAGVESATPNAEVEEGNEGVLTLIFSSKDTMAKPIEWQEFFDTFELRQLRFRYDDPLRPGEEPASVYDFEDRETPTDMSSDETELPDEVDDVVENMFPSAPNSDTKEA